MAWLILFSCLSIVCVYKNQTQAIFLIDEQAWLVVQVSGLAVQDTEMQNVDGGIQGLKKKLEAGDDEEKTEKVSALFLL